MAEWDGAAAVAERQHMAVATWQLRLLGISEAAITDRPRRHGWRRPHRGVLTMPGSGGPLTEHAAALLAYSRPAKAPARVEELLADDTPLVDALVHAAFRGGPVLCGESALWLYGLQGPPAHPCIRLPRGSGNATRGGISFRYGPILGEPRWIDDLPLVCVEQAFLDLAGTRGEDRIRLYHRLVKVISRADGKRITSLPQVDTAMASAGRVVGSVLLGDVLADLRGELSHSGPESGARKCVAEVLKPYGLSLHPRPYEVFLGSRRVGEADLAVVPIRLDLEIDGPHHREPEQRDADQVRDRLVRRAGWEVERFPTELVDLSPRTFKARVDEVVRARRQALATTTSSL